MTPRTIKPARGQIYDRWGSLSAGNRTVYEVGLELQLVSDPKAIAGTLSSVLDIDYADVYAAASIEASEDAVYAVVADNITQDKIDKLEALRKIYAASSEKNPPSLRGVVYNPHLARAYPDNSLASNVLGFVVREGDGYFGVEGYYDNLLAGTPKTVLVPLDPNRVRELPDVPDGTSLVLTLDRDIQRAMEELVDAALKETGAQSGTIIVENPRTGEILAMATTPRLNLNEYWRYDEIFKKDTSFNRAVSGTYEPGSVFKVLTMAAALDAGAVKPETVFVDTGVIEVGGLRIYNWNMGAWGPQNMQGCMQHSLNVCLAWVATQLGAEKFYSYMQAFGFGRLTGIDLADEVSGRLKIPGDGDWYEAELGTNAFGQGVAVTPIQMIAAVSAVANDGRIVTPHVVRSMASESYQRDKDLRTSGIPLKAETAHILTEMLANALETEASDALVTGYRVAGKTGTAEIPGPFGYTTNETNASFVGWGPVDDPQFLVYVWLEKPASSPWGSVVAAPLFRQVVEKLVVLLDLPPDDVRHSLALPAQAAPTASSVGSQP
ncbi:MAG: penicillin-binding protein 2 [Chloroflexota bacterium]